jgi:hypothetical protein
MVLRTKNGLETTSRGSEWIEEAVRGDYLRNLEHDWSSCIYMFQAVRM